MPTQRYPSLVVVVNSEHTLWYELTESGMELIHELTEKHDHYSDREGFFAASVHGKTTTTGASDATNTAHEEHLHHHLRHTAEETKRLWKPEYRYLFTAIPEQDKNVWSDELERAVPGTPVHLLLGNHVHTTKEALRHLVEKSFGVQ